MDKGILENVHDGENLFYCHRQPQNQIETVKMHYHGDIEFLYGIDCDMNVWIDGRVWNVKSGEFIIIRPFETHAVASENRKSEHLVIRFVPELLKYKGQSKSHEEYALLLTDSLLGGRRILSREDVCETGIGKEFKCVVDEYYKRDFGYEIAVQQGILRIFLLLSRYWQKKEGSLVLSESHSSIALIRRAAAQVAENINDVNEHQAAESCFMSYTYFSRTFKKVIGVSYSDYVITIKLRNAQRLLMTTDKAISDIAAETGFSDSSHLIHQFKKHYGMSPYAYKREVKKKFE